jgi:glycosyltransferase involved in cell wall biosynthesis
VDEISSPGRIAFVGGFEPRRCGIATFTHDLCEAVAEAAPLAQCFAGALNDRSDGYKYPPRVRFEILESDLDSYRRAADFLNFNNAEVLCVQHEFGIYGGPAGSHVLAMLKEVRMPVVTTLHTVLQRPDPAQRQVMEELVRRSERLVVMARKGAEILQETYGVAASKVDVIPHGIPDVPFADPDFYKARFGVEGCRVLLTFGLLGPGKGIEHAIGALPEIVRRHPDAVYLILGATHPHLVAREGESYRLGLERLAENLGVREHVVFYNRFVSDEELAEFIGAADIYLTPYLNEAQITSGTLAYVFGAGNAVVSTPYWHAQELLAEGRGILVPFRDPQAIAAGVCEFLDGPERLARTRREAYQFGRETIWPAVARSYLESFRQARAAHNAAPRATVGGWKLGRRSYDLPPLRLDHIMRMSDGTGIFQHATFTVPNFHEGYCTDDNARAFILCNLLEEPGRLDHLATSYLAFLAAALNHETGRFRNFMSHGREWLEPAGSEDSHGRALWALGVGAGRSRNEGHRRLCVQLFDRGLPVVESFNSPRAWAFTLLGVHELLGSNGDDAKAGDACEILTGKLVTLWHNCATEDWQWFETRATYDNARLSQALMLSGKATAGEALEIGLKSLRWLVSMQKTQAGNFRPIGSNGFHEKDGARADFDQQPVESHAMVAACLEAFRITRDPFWSVEAKRAFEWFLGRNDLGLPLYDYATGGCGDGLHHDRVNANQGAESSLAFHLSLAEMNHSEPVPSSHANCAI